MVLRERRKFNRDICSDNVDLQDLYNDNLFTVKCVDISLGGIGIEIPSKLIKRLPENSLLEVWIYKPNNKEPVHRFGRIVWVKKDNRGQCRGGIKFIPSSKSLS